MINQELWDKAVAFHGHACSGLTLGYRAALYAAKLLDTGRADDEEIVCITENDACGLDAIQIILGCSVGKGNLLFHLTGKQAYTFYRRSDGKGFRLVQKKKPVHLSKAERYDYYHSCADEELFEVQQPVIALPEPARNFTSVTCARCGEATAENYIHVQEGRLLCPDCAGKPYSRFDV